GGARHQHLGPEAHCDRYVALEECRDDAGKPAQRDTQIAPLLPAERAEPLDQGGGVRMPHGVIWRSHQHAEAAHPVALLRARRERPRSRSAADERDELAPLHHSITSSASASRLAGTSMPSAFAVLRLITKSNLIGCCTGMSAGFSPFRIRAI